MGFGPLFYLLLSVTLAMNPVALANFNYSPRPLDETCQALRQMALGCSPTLHTLLPDLRRFRIWGALAFKFKVQG